MLALSIPGAQRGQMRRHQRRRPTPSLPPLSSCGGRAGDGCDRFSVRPAGNGNFEYINGKGTDKSRTESWEKLKAGDARVGPALRTPGEA